MRAVVDIETNGLAIDLDTIWCIVAQDYDNGKQYTWDVTDLHYLKRFREWAQEHIDLYIGHNFLLFDKVHLRRLAQLRMRVNQVEDTLILSRLFSPIRDQGHSLARWGRFLKYPKMEYDEWDKWDPTILERCKKDVALNAKVYTYLLNEGKRFSLRSRRMEHDVAYVLEEARLYGHGLERDKADKLYQLASAKATELRNRIVANFPDWPKPIRDISPRYNKDGALSCVGLKFMPKWDTKVVGEFTRIDWVPFNLNSPKQVVARVARAGWKPVEFTKVGTPKITETNLETLSVDAPKEAKLIRPYLVYDSRAKMVKTWLDNLGEDGRLHPKIFHIGANTHRGSHRDPNSANVPAVLARTGALNILGRESRECWIASPGRCLVGADASGMQLRLLAHLMQDPPFTKAVVEGKPHEYNAKLWGTTKPQEKTFIFAMLLGAGDAKLGFGLGGSAADGRDMRATALDKMPALVRVKEMMTQYARNGWFPCPDGRLIAIKSAHFALGVALQGLEQAVMKLAMIYWYKHKKKEGLDSHLVNWIHDEVQLDTIKDLTTPQRSGKLFIEGIVQAGKSLRLRVPLDGEYKVGDSWAETH